MTAYVANHEKKNRIFAKREQELLHVSDEKIAVAAEKVREAKMNVFKCRFSKSSPHQPHTFLPEQAAADDQKIQQWLLMSTADIIANYRTQATR